MRVGREKPWIAGDLSVTLLLILNSHIMKNFIVLFLLLLPQQHTYENFFDTMDKLSAKIKRFDPSMGKLINHPANDEPFFEAKDAHGNRVQFDGSDKGIGEIAWIWNHKYNVRPTPLVVNNFEAICKLMCGAKGQQWVALELKKKALPQKPIVEYTTINYNKVSFFNDGISTITLKIQPI